MRRPSSIVSGVACMPECGLCTIVLDGRPVNSCLVFAAEADGAVIETSAAENAGDGTLSALQQAFVDHTAFQCSYCTPGFLMLAVGVLEREPDIGDEELLDILSSNLCRCTGYQNIVTSVRAAAAAMRGDAPAGAAG